MPLVVFRSLYYQFNQMAKFQSQNSAKFSPDDPSVSGNDNEPSGHSYLWQSSEDEESSFLGLIDRVGCYDSGKRKFRGFFFSKKSREIFK
jgi:hypothetical protein